MGGPVPKSQDGAQVQNSEWWRPSALTVVGSYAWLTHWLGQVSVALVLAGVAVELAGGRWGAYIRSPIPGVQLGDLLLIVGAICALPQFRRIRYAPRVIYVSLLPCAYLVFRIVDSLGHPSGVTSAFWIRDLAPFAYLSLVPLLSLSLANGGRTWLITVVRWSSIVYAAGYVIASLDVVSPFPSGLLSSNAVAVLEYRGDFTGLALGLGILAWGEWNGLHRTHIVVQSLLFGIALTPHSRASALTAVFFYAAGLWRARRDYRWFMILACVFGALALSVVLAAGVNFAQTQKAESKLSTSGSVGNSESQANPPGDASKPTIYVPALDKALSPAGDATASARIATYALVLRYLGEDRRWILGEGPGTDALYTACTGLPLAPAQTRSTGTEGTVYLPKCPVDSYEAASTLRDPHQWALNLMLYHGLVGLIVFVCVTALPLIVTRREENASFSVLGSIGIGICASLGVILSAPFGLIPLVALIAAPPASVIRSRASVNLPQGND